MRIVQILPTITMGDAVSNETLAFYHALKEAGYDTAIYAQNIGDKLPKGFIYRIDEYKDDADFIIYHLSIGGEINNRLMGYKAKCLIVYHNVTPEEFFAPYSMQSQMLCREGIEAVKMLYQTPVMCIADSEFNKQDLIRLGYTCDIKVLPILMQFDDYDKKPSQNVLKRFKDDGYVNILFTGRIAPNKKQEDIIRSFYYYKTYINPKSRLILAGSYQEQDIYARKLRKYIKQLELDDVIMTGHIPFDEILAYYHLADVFVVLSEHEGFCVPLVEAMYFGKPIVAYDSTAVGETLGDAGILLKDKDPKLVAEAIDRIVKDTDLRDYFIQAGKDRLATFAPEKVKKQFIQIVEEAIK
ncbi:Glycosyltransferase involved in cell wall bisynthesis [Butyrivibrio sp. ob235]|uniref:glycosyltransferase family 4 protein n=1 Tax=Butyrivibrio sp. ob235 TaxID=1761780 RepID=UPI0008CD4ECB|nr:glycosyltransferase family 4 protein [Butyrivibrio sp. ob235]SEL96575.1 Glycosyltransferase involved in cell wall bisynthesis [Butyrivibrio sp. ob235]